MTTNPIVKRKEKIWLSAPHMSGHEMKYIEEAFSRGHVFPMGPNVAGFEQDIMKLTGIPHCSCLSSGTAALHLALIMLGIEEGDEVVCSSFTFSASANPIRYQSALPVFIDSELDTWNMDPSLLSDAIKERIANGKKPKAIILVHLYGMPAKIGEILEIAREYEIPVIEDAAEALGSTYQGKHCGTFGLMGIYSFNGNKIITTSGGGALVSDIENYCMQATFLATQARDQAPHYQHSHVGYNYRMSNICAGIGRGQIEVFLDWLAKRRENFFFYRENLADLEELSFLSEPDSTYISNHWLTTLQLNPKKSSTSVNELRIRLEQREIECRPLWKPMHLQPIFKDYPAFVNGNSENLFNHGLCIPSSTNITDDDRQFVADSIRGILRKK